MALTAPQINVCETMTEELYVIKEKIEAIQTDIEKEITEDDNEENEENQGIVESLGSALACLDDLLANLKNAVEA